MAGERSAHADPRVPLGWGWMHRALLALSSCRSAWANDAAHSIPAPPSGASASFGWRAFQWPGDGSCWAPKDWLPVPWIVLHARPCWASAGGRLDLSMVSNLLVVGCAAGGGPPPGRRLLAHALSPLLCHDCVILAPLSSPVTNCPAGGGPAPGRRLLARARRAAAAAGALGAARAGAGATAGAAQRGALQVRPPSW
jgi:hypothetical protein